MHTRRGKREVLTGDLDDRPTLRVYPLAIDEGLRADKRCVLEAELWAHPDCQSEIRAKNKGEPERTAAVDAILYRNVGCLGMNEERDLRGEAKRRETEKRRKKQEQTRCATSGAFRSAELGSVTSDRL